MKPPGIFLLPPGWDEYATHHRVTPSSQFAHTHYFMHLGVERHCESKVSCPRTQHNVPRRGSNLNRSIQSQAHQQINDYNQAGASFYKWC